MGRTHPVMAQRISMAPNIGVYIPTTELVKAASGEEFKQEMSLTVGGRLGILLSHRIGLEFTGAYAPSDLKISQAGFGDQSQDANVFTGSGRISYQLIPLTSPISFEVTGGVGVINRSGEFYASMENKTDIGGTVGAQPDSGWASSPAFSSALRITFTSRRERSPGFALRTRRRPRMTCTSRSASEFHSSDWAMGK